MTISGRSSEQVHVETPAFADTYFQIWAAMERVDLPSLTALLTDDCVLEFTGRTFRGRAAAAEYFAAVMAGLPDLRHEVTALVERRGLLAAEVIATGTHTGPLRIGEHLLEPSGRTIEFRAADVLWFEGDLVGRWHAYYDSATLTRQLVD